MPARFVRPEPTDEYLTPEGCYILESWNDPVDPAVSIARARVEPGATTQAHRLKGVIERYLIIEGEGRAAVDGVESDVRPGDVVMIPAGASQRIANSGTRDLVFYCICAPRFTPACYETLE